MCYYKCIASKARASLRGHSVLPGWSVWQVSEPIPCQVVSVEEVLPMISVKCVCVCVCMCVCVCVCTYVVHAHVCVRGTCESEVHLLPHLHCLAQV